MHGAEIWWQFPINHSPVEVELFHAGRYRRFRRAFWEAGRAGVALQYREVACPASWHLYVYFDGRYVVDHLDSANPDPPCNLPVKHLVQDVPGGGWFAALGLVALGGLAFIGVRAMNKSS